MEETKESICSLKFSGKELHKGSLYVCVFPGNLMPSHNLILQALRIYWRWYGGFWYFPEVLRWDRLWQLKWDISEVWSSLEVWLSSWVGMNWHKQWGFLWTLMQFQKTSFYEQHRRHNCANSKNNLKSFQYFWGVCILSRWWICQAKLWERKKVVCWPQSKEAEEVWLPALYRIFKVSELALFFFQEVRSFQG